jgi:hypothetical protein
VTFPTIGAGPKTWDFTEALCAEFAEDFPDVDIASEVRHAHAWVRANSPKTASGMRAFITRWLTKAANDGRRPFGAAPRPRGPIRPGAVPVRPDKYAALQAAAEAELRAENAALATEAQARCVAS